MPEINYKALGFVLSSSDAAEVLGNSIGEVHDLVRSGELTALVSSPGPLAPLMFHFHPDEVSQTEVRLRKLSNGSTLSTDVRNRVRVQKALRAYLEAVPASGDYDTALAGNAPLWGRTRNGTPVLHVRAEAVASFGTVADGIPVTMSMTRAALDYLGALRVRGITPVNEPGQQRWGVWFRLADGFAPGDDDESAVIRGIIFGAREPGERVTRRGMGPAYLADSLDPDSEDID